MKRLLVLFILAVLTSGALFAQIKSGSPAWISAKKADIKSSTGFFASNRGSLELGAEVSVLSINGKWAEVRSATNTSLSGWTTASNLSARRIVASGTSASASEVALAAKGFNQDVENAYKTKGDLKYADVDKTEAITGSQDDLYKFITEGRLNTGKKKEKYKTRINRNFSFCPFGIILFLRDYSGYWSQYRSGSGYSQSDTSGSIAEIGRGGGLMGKSF
jgi:hypothetical protein